MQFSLQKVIMNIHVEHLISFPVTLRHIFSL
uniref:Transcriptional corepressor LEUNIG_HOMOLOG n=1 Tax=Rhizophora mucronata TaxID=61149 RepID=A0A2P2PSH6_RHIMU